MASFNQVILIGNMGNDPEAHDSQGVSITKISIATERRTKADSKPVVDWHRITLFGNSATYTNRNLRKGDLVFVRGTIQTSKWKDKEGKDQYSIEIVGDEIRPLNKKAKAESGGGYNDHDTI